MVNCLVCGKPTSATHMGMDACRTCTVFYRRTREFRDKLYCANGRRPCVGFRKRLFSCRKCRMDRFEAVMRAGSGADNAITSPNSAQYTQHDTRKFSRTRALSDFRLNGELCLRGIVLDRTVSTNEYDYLIPSKYTYATESTKLLIAGLFEFCRLTFPEFQLLSIPDKWLLIRNYQKLFHAIDGKLRMMRKFGNGSSKVYCTYTTYVSLDDVDHFFNSCPDKSNANTAEKTLHEWLTEHVPKLKKEVEQINPSDDEFVAMIGLALWSLENLDASDQLLSMAARYRTEIISELAASYQQTMGKERGASRIGDLLCLLHEFFFDLCQ